jgi:alpha-tubulin suppressor-like RCC1 family protein
MLCVVINIASSSLVNSKFIKETESGVYSFGRNSYGQLGLGNTIDQTTPQLISTLKNEKIINVVCGHQHNIIITGKFNSLKKQRMVSIHLDTIMKVN